MNQEGVYRTALATLGLLNININGTQENYKFRNMGCVG